MLKGFDTSSLKLKVSSPYYKYYTAIQMYIHNNYSTSDRNTLYIKLFQTN